MLALAVAGFVYGAGSLFLARYERGDVYPRYSSFRSDPLGTKALFEAMKSMPGVRVERNLESIDRAAGRGGVTLFVNGYSFLQMGPFIVTELDGGLARSLQKFMIGGGRVVISFAPLTQDYTASDVKDRAFLERMAERQQRTAEDGGVGAREDDAPPAEEKPEEAKPEKVREESIVDLPPPSDGAAKDGAKNDADGDDVRDTPEDGLSRYEDMGPPPVDWEELWGVALQFDALDRDPTTRTYAPKTARRTMDAAVPETVPVRTTLSFGPVSDEWHTVYADSDKAVLIERSVGDGTLVLVADAFLLSNEAMRAERHPDFLTWLAGPNASILFDETTLGTERSRGLASLMWQYRLQGVVAALILLAALYIWKNGQPLVPPFHDALPTDAYAYEGKDSASGLTNLLKRSVPPGQVLRTCLAEWEKSFGHRATDLAGSVRDAKAIVLREDGVPAKQRDLVRAYKDVCAVFARHRLR